MSRNRAKGLQTVLPIRDRIKEFRRVRAKELVWNPKNWRTHPKAQQAALRALLSEIGYADALLVRQLPDGRLMLIDGHLRAETTPDALVPVLVLDVNEEEADKLLLTLDPLAAMAEADAERISQLLATVRTEDPAIEHLLRRTAGEGLWQALHPDEIQEAEVPFDRAGAFREKWGTDLGQHWQIGPHHPAKRTPRLVSVSSRKGLGPRIGNDQAKHFAGVQALQIAVFPRIAT